MLCGVKLDEEALNRQDKLVRGRKYECSFQELRGQFDSRRFLAI